MMLRMLWNGDDDGDMDAMIATVVMMSLTSLDLNDMHLATVTVTWKEKMMAILPMMILSAGDDVVSDGGGGGGVVVWWWWLGWWCWWWVTNGGGGCSGLGVGSGSATQSAQPEDIELPTASLRCPNGCCATFPLVDKRSHLRICPHRKASRIPELSTRPLIVRTGRQQ